MLIMMVAVMLDYRNIVDSNIILQPTTPNKMSLTNSPASVSFCVQTYVELDIIRPVGCQTGLIHELFDVGIVPGNNQFK